MALTSALRYVGTAIPADRVRGGQGGSSWEESWMWERAPYAHPCPACLTHARWHAHTPGCPVQCAIATSTRGCVPSQSPTRLCRPTIV